MWHCDRYWRLKDFTCWVTCLCHSHGLCHDFHPRIKIGLLLDVAFAAAIGLLPHFMLVAWLVAINASLSREAIKPMSMPYVPVALLVVDLSWKTEQRFVHYRIHVEGSSSGFLCQGLLEVLI